MTRAWQQTLAPGQVLPAPTTGVFLGRNKEGPLSLRLFRRRGTRMAVFSDPHVAQLLTLRAAVGGATVRVVTQRHAIWTPSLRHGLDAQIAPATAYLPVVQPGPSLFVDDLPDAPRPTGEVTDWQCLLHVRTLDGQHLDSARVANFAHVDVAFFSALPGPLAAEVGQMFDLGEAAASLTVVPPHAVAVVARGRVQLVRPELSAAERTTLGAGAHSAI